MLTVTRGSRLRTPPGRMRGIRQYFPGGEKPDEHTGVSRAPGLHLDPEQDVSHRHCDQCGRNYVLVKGFVYRDDVPYAIYLAACHAHEGMREAWIDVVLGTFGEDDWSDHVTFGVRVGPVEGQVEPAATMVQAAIPYGDAPVFGAKLNREEGLAHPRLEECWEVVDFVLLADETVNQHVYDR